MGEHSNVEEVTEVLNAIVDGFGFDLTVDDKDLGRHCIKIVATDIQERSARGEGSEGEWDENTEDYAKYKKRVYGVTEQPNVRTGDMLSDRALSIGTVGHETVDMEYGTGDTPRTGVAGRPVKSADEKITDREKAGYAHDGQGPHGTERPFYVIHDTAASDIQELCQQRLNEYAQEKWGK
jgi:hypothetical protein